MSEPIEPIDAPDPDDAEFWAIVTNVTQDPADDENLRDAPW